MTIRDIWHLLTRGYTDADKESFKAKWLRRRELRYEIKGFERATIRELRAAADLTYSDWHEMRK